MKFAVAKTKPLLVILLAITCLCLAGCGDASPPDSKSTSEGDEQQTHRIVSLAPALSKMVADMGMLDNIVGVQMHDDVVGDRAPVVGTYVDINPERMIAQNPTHVLMMVGKEGVPEVIRTMQEQGSLQLHAWPYPANVEKVLDIIWHETQTDLGDALNMPNAARRLRQDVEQRLDRLRVRTNELPQQRVLIVIGLNPLMASGPDTVFDDLLNFINAKNASDATVMAPVYDRESLLTLDPDVILIMQPNAKPLTDLESDDRLKIFRGLKLKAMADKQVHALNDPLIFLPSSNLPDVAKQMAEAVHKELREESNNSNE